MVEELAAADALVVSLREENASLREANDSLRVKVAALVEIAFGGSERRGANNRPDAQERLGDLGDDCADEGAGDGAGPEASDGSGGEDAASGPGDKRHRGQRRGARGHGRRR